MSGFLGRFPVLDAPAGMLILPAWTAGALAAVLVVGCLIAFNRMSRDGLAGGLAPVVLVLLGAGAAWVVLDGSSRRDVFAERQALDTRASQLSAQAMMPGSALACLDAMAGEAVETACEKALFATPEAAAAAVSYVSAQLGLLADATSLARRERSYDATAARLRHVLEGDRFGIVAQALAMRDGCTADRCSTFALLSDASHVSANLTDRTYDLYVSRYVAGWPQTAGSPVARATAPGSLAAAPSAVPGANLRAPGPNVFFPSAASIPPVNIMNAEPPAPETTATTPPATAAKPPAAPRKAAPAVRRPVDLNAEAGRATPSPAPAQ
jgi:hypothetical protein